MLNIGKSQNGLVSVCDGRSVSNLRVGRAARLAWRSVALRLLHHQDANGAALADDLWLPPVVGVHRVERAHESALGVALLRLVVQHHHNLAGDVDASKVIVLILGRRDAVTGKDERRNHSHVHVTLASQGEIGAQRVVARRSAAAARRGAEARTQVRRVAVEVRLHHWEILKEGASVPHRLQPIPMKEAGNVLRRDPPLCAHRVAAAHLARGEEIDVTLQRISPDRQKARIRLREGEQRCGAKQSQEQASRDGRS